MYYGDQGRYHKGFKGVDGPPVHRVKLRHSSVVTTRPPFYGATRRTVCSYVMKIYCVIRVKLNQLV